MSSIKAYPATIESIAVHPNADKLKLATILGYQIIVGLDAQVGQSGWLYLPDAIIKEEVVKYFSLDYLSKGRVRQVKLRGEYSDGLFINTSTMLVENPFDMDAIWEEYIPVTKYKGEPNNKAAKKQNIIAKVFPKHMDTQQYLANKTVIEKLVNDGWNISYSVKTHGTSGRSAYVFKPVIPPVTFMEKAILKVSSWLRMYTKYMSYLEKKYEYVIESSPSYLTGSRNVIFSGDNTSTLREGFTDILAPSMEVGMIMYYEILGWESPEKPIMEPYKGKPYDYGIPKGEAGIQVYRITKYGDDLSLDEMHEYCDTYGIPYVKQIFADSPEEAFQHSIVPITCEVLLTSNDVWTYRYDHTNEGLVIRLDNPITKEVKLFKYKNREFLIQEGVLAQQSDE